MLPLTEFKLERYFAKYEFAVRYLLSPSDCEGVSVAELLALADATGRQVWDELRLGYTESPGSRRCTPRLPGSIAWSRLNKSSWLRLRNLIAMHSLLRAGNHMLCG